MKNKLNAEKIEKGYKDLIKKISDEHLRDMLSILYSEPELAIYNRDFEQLAKEEKDHYQNDRMKMTLFDKQKLGDLRDMLVNDFHIFESVEIPDPVLGTSPSYPKASLLSALIKSTINLRENGKELPDEQIIKLVECFTSEHSANDYTIVINEDYLHPIKLSKNIKIWGMFFDLIQNGYLDRNDSTQDLYDYLNYNPNNKITTNTKYPRQVIIEQNDSSYKPLFKTSVQTEKALIQRQNKLKGST